MTPFADIAFINVTATGAIMAPRNSPSCFVFSSFTVSVAPSVKRPKSPSDFAVLITYKSSFEMIKVDLFPALAAPCPLIFFQIYLR